MKLEFPVQILENYSNP